MKLELRELVSNNPIYIKGIGNVYSPLLNDITLITYKIYDLYIGYLNMTPEKYCKEIDSRLSEWYSNLTDDDLFYLNMFDLILSNKDLIKIYESIFNFFIKENVVFNVDTKTFLVHEEISDNIKIIGEINKQNYTELCDVILQLNHVNSDNSFDLSKVKNKKGLERFKRIQELKNKNKKTSNESNPDLEIGNIISHVCIKHKSINYTNVYNMTIYQLWDTFMGLQEDNVYESNKMSVSIWGDKENKFDFNSWFKKRR